MSLAPYLHQAAAPLDALEIVPDATEHRLVALARARPARAATGRLVAWLRARAGVRGRVEVETRGRGA